MQIFKFEIIMVCVKILYQYNYDDHILYGLSGLKPFPASSGLD